MVVCFGELCVVLVSRAIVGTVAAFYIVYLGAVPVGNLFPVTDRVGGVGRRVGSTEVANRPWIDQFIVFFLAIPARIACLGVIDLVLLGGTRSPPGLLWRPGIRRKIIFVIVVLLIDICFPFPGSLGLS
jgi:hypothetical protein